MGVGSLPEISNVCLALAIPRASISNQQMCFMDVKPVSA